MALAKKCDCCGKLYEYYTTRPNGIALIDIDVRGGWNPDKVLDLCADCKDSILSLIENQCHKNRES